MRTICALLARVRPSVTVAARAHFDVDDALLAEIRPIDRRDRDMTPAEFSLDVFRSRNFSFQFVGAAGREREAADAQEYDRLLAIWSKCQATPPCAQQGLSDAKVESS